MRLAAGTTADAFVRAARVLAGLAAAAIVLASIGLYGLLAFSVSRRTREIGLRMALGATPGAMAGWVFTRGLALAVFSAAIALTMGLALFGTLLPALRASRVSPLEATRE